MPRDRTTAAAWAGTLLLLTLCLLPAWTLPASGDRLVVGPHLDKLVHLAMFAMFSGLWTLAGRSSPWTRVGRVLVASALLAVGTEIAQGHPMIHREPDPLDALADAFGAVFGIAVALPWVWSRRAADAPVAAEL